MQPNDIYDNMKERLIIAGIKEIEEHGLIDFSLRRVSASCSVSCAAPYKHFKNKNDFILSIIKYISGQWKMLEKQIIKIYSFDKFKLIEELSAAYVRFWIANPNFRSILFMNPAQMDDEQKKARAEIDKEFINLITECEKGNNKKETVYEIRSLIYGALLMIESGELTNDKESINMIKNAVRKRL